MIFQALHFNLCKLKFRRTSQLLALSISLFLNACAPSEKTENFHPGIYVSKLNSTISVSATTVTVGQSITLSAFIRDQNFNAYSDSTAHVEFIVSGGSSTGTLGDVTTLGDGIFTVTFTGVNSGSASRVHVFVDGNEMQSALPSVQVVAIPVPSVPSSMSASSGVSSIALNWTASSGSGTITYTVLRSITSGSGYVAIANGVSVTHYSDSTAVAGTIYYYVVNATNAGGASGNSSEVSAHVFSSFAQQWATLFANASSYEIGTNVDFNGSSNSCELAPASQVDQSNVSAGFAGGSFTGIAFNTLSDGVSTGLKLASDGTCNGATTNCNELNASWTPQYSSLIGYWKLNGSGSITNGASVPAVVGSNGTASNSNGTGLVYATGKLNQGITFDGVDDSISLGTLGNFGSSLSSPATISFWVKTSSTASSSSFGFINTGATTLLKIDFNTGGNLVYTAGATEFELRDDAGKGVSGWITTDIYDGKWHLLTVVMNGPANTYTAYVDGVTATMNYNLQTTPTNFSNLGFPFTLGAQNNRGVVNSFFAGSIDDVAFWSAGLTASEVATIYNQQSSNYSGSFTSRVMDAFSSQAWTSLSWVPTLPFFKALPDYASGAIQNETAANYSSLKGDTPAVGDNNLMTGLVGLWHLDEASGTTGSNSVIDTSGQGNHGTPTSISFGETGRFANSAYFSGSGYINLGANVANYTDNFTISSWFQTTTNTGRPSISRRNGSSTQFDIWISLNKFCVYTGTTYCGSTVVTDGKWHQGVLVVNGANSQLYVDGVADRTVFTPTISAVSTNAILGAWNSGSNNRFTGKIDEVAVWNKVLNATEIQQLYQRGASRLKFQVRSCSDSACTTGSPTFKCPDGTSATFFSELFNMSTQSLTPSGTVNATLPSMALPNYTSPVSSNRYFQYRTIFESDASTLALMPELKSVTIGPTHYDSSAPSVISKAGVSYDSLSNAIQTLGANACSSGVLYNLGVGVTYSSATWYWWNGSTWVSVTSPGVAQANDAATIASHANTFGAQAGAGTLYFKAYLQSSGTSACELQNFELDGLQ